MIYFDSSYLVRLYLEDRGFEIVREVAATDALACSHHGQAEVLAAFHRQFREGSITRRAFSILIAQFSDEIRSGAFRWLPLSDAILDRISSIFAKLPASIFLRAADALHLASAAQNGFREIYSNDKKLLAAAPHFMLRGLDIIK